MISLSPMDALRERAEQQINDRFNTLAARHAQRDAEHLRKRLAAEAVLAGAPAPAWFADAAAIDAAGDVEVLARTIAEKPDDVADRGNARRALILRVRSAATRAELQQALQDLPPFNEA